MDGIWGQYAMNCLLLMDSVQLVSAASMTSNKMMQKGLLSVDAGLNTRWVNLLSAGQIL